MISTYNNNTIFIYFGYLGQFIFFIILKYKYIDSVLVDTYLE